MKGRERIASLLGQLITNDTEGEAPTTAIFDFSDAI